jgi:lactoylglutathione lyase
MHYLHTMVRVSNLDDSLEFYCNQLGLIEVKRTENDKGRFTLIFLAAPTDLKQADTTKGPMLELTYNWDPQDYSEGRNFGHLAYGVKNIYKTCQRLKEAGIIINRPPRDGYMAFIRSPDHISIELLQQGEPLPPQEPWLSMANVGHW